MIYTLSRFSCTKYFPLKTTYIPVSVILETFPRSMATKAGTEGLKTRLI
ncbi:Protein of unknown function [Pyronema omphalodes CBS 100304]|uniref:Uncharacterized protein n=1 Tax=Pyronema omphalodes (strain CBS 100304) TaxID=1076935 RepID=U4LAB2_PYROM|nr:Protein of unknown function [Pyronema omphalodes CBS 100304]